MHLNRACHLLLHYYNWISNREDTETTIGVVVLHFTQFIHPWTKQRADNNFQLMNIYKEILRGGHCAVF